MKHGGEREGRDKREERERREEGRKEREEERKKMAYSPSFYLPYRSRMETLGRSPPTSMLYCRRSYKASILHWKRGTAYTACETSCDTRSTLCSTVI